MGLFKKIGKAVSKAVKDVGKSGIANPNLTKELSHLLI